MCRLFLTICILLPVSAQALTHYYADIDQAEWQVEQTRIRCELNQIIPYYGKARFVISAGGEMSFWANTFTPILANGAATVVSMPPFWRASDPKELGQSTIAKGDIPFHITGGLANRMLYELDLGMEPTFKYKDSFESKDDIWMSLSSVRYLDKRHQFNHCINQLIPYGIEELKSVTVSFKTNLHKLSDTVKRDL